MNPAEPRWYRVKARELYHKKGSHHLELHGEIKTRLGVRRKNAPKPSWKCQIFIDDKLFDEHVIAPQTGYLTGLSKTLHKLGFGTHPDADAEIKYRFDSVDGQHKIYFVSVPDPELIPVPGTDPPEDDDEPEGEGEMADELQGLEGEDRIRMMRHRRREQKLRTEKVKKALEANGGHLPCEVPGCGFDFLEVYGELGRDYAQVHHREPLATRTAPSRTKLEDLAIVCANCHAMIHRGGKCRDLKDLCSGTATR